VRDAGYIALKLRSMRRRKKKKNKRKSKKTTPQMTMTSSR
jgi:hypothetical protein